MLNLSLTDASSKVGKYTKNVHSTKISTDKEMQETFRKAVPCKGKERLLIQRSFTTIDPQRAIGYLQISCACARYDVSDRCKPNYGACVQGKRSVPIELLDVAGLVPGAHEGKGLGNKFLDDLRHADALVHVVDVSGTTDAEGRLSLCQNPATETGRLMRPVLRKGHQRLRSIAGYCVA